MSTSSIPSPDVERRATAEGNGDPKRVPQETHPDATSEHSVLRGARDIRPTKTGVQKRIDALVRLRHNLEAQINERDQCIARLQATNEELAAQLKHGMLENAELQTVNFRLQEALARCIKALRKRRMNG
jgi:hypothetical protein